MNSRTFTEPKNKNSTTFSPVFGKKLPDRIFTPESANKVRDLSSPNFGRNFGDVKVESPSFKQSCSLSLSGPAHFPFGGACHTCPPRVQAKLKIGQPGDKYEQEADRVADQVMRIHDTIVHDQIKSTAINLQTKGISEKTSDVSPQIESNIKSLSSGKGQPLPESTITFFEPHFGDLSQVRVHSNSISSKTADTIKAKAFTVGNNIIFGTGQCLPGSKTGKKLLAHELTHVIQQTHASPICNQMLIQRVSAGEWFSRFFGGGTFSDKELKDYLYFLDVEDRIENDFDSDNKAREIVQRWKQGRVDYYLSIRRKVLLIKEMISGFTGDDDERAILDLIEGSNDAEVAIILDKSQGVGVDEIRNEFHTEEAVALERFLEAWSKKRSKDLRPQEAVSKKATIENIVVDQKETQTVTIHWTDGRKETDICSTGKGFCCVDTSGGASSAGWSGVESNVKSTNRTPVGNFHVRWKREKRPSGIKFWTHFHTRPIALHSYWPVDGTALSHGCVRLKPPMAEKIFNGSVSAEEKSRKYATNVKVINTPTPRCDHPLLQREWAKDFQTAGKPLDRERTDAKPPKDKEKHKREQKDIEDCRYAIRKSLGITNKISKKEMKDAIKKLSEAMGDFPENIPSSTSAGTLRTIYSVAEEIPRCHLKLALSRKILSKSDAGLALEVLKSLRSIPHKLKEIISKIPRKKYQQFPAMLSEKEKNENLRFLMEMEMIRTSGMTLDEMSLEQKKFLELAASKEGISVGEYIRGEAKKKGYGGNEVTWWPSLTPKEKQEWINTFKEKLKEVKAQAPVEILKLIQSAEKAGGGIQFKPERAEELGAYAFRDGAVLGVGKLWIEAAKKDVKNVFANIAHELGGHRAYGATLSWEIMGKTLSKLPESEQDIAKGGKKHPWTVYAYPETELYAELHELPHTVAGSIGDDPRKAKKGYKEGGVEKELNRIKGAFAPKVAEAILRGFRRRIYLDPSITKDARKFFDAKVLKIFKIKF